jgi:hypothetical protein
MVTNVIASPPHRQKAANSTPDLPYNRASMKATKPLTINSIDVDNDEELDALMDQVLAEGDKVYEAQYKEALRLGIIDEKGRLLKHELPEDMREDAGTDFGG